jgi:hypothetical protein
LNALLGARARISPGVLEGLLSATVAVCVGIALAWFGPPGGDLAAHAYLRTLFLQHGFTLWDNFWYAGRYSFVTYSLAYYPLAALVGIKVLAVATVGVAGLGFAVVLDREWGPVARPSSRVFAVVWAGVVLAGVYPFALGMAFALLALWALQAGGRRSFAALALLTLASSPLAFLVLAMILAGVVVARRQDLRCVVPPLLTMLSLACLGLGLWRLFPAGGLYPFPAPEFLAAAAFSIVGAVLTWRSHPAKPLHYIFLIYLAACTGAFLMPSALGENIARLRLAALPLAVLVLSLRQWRPRPVAVAVLALAVAWNLSPVVVNLFQGVRDTSARPAYWQPAITFLRAHTTPSYRVEVVDTVDHWEAAYLPPSGIPIARGWYRQDDLPFNRALYARQLNAHSYINWLHRLGVRWVVLTDQPPDYSAHAEATLLLSGHSGLRLTTTLPGAAIYSVPQPRPIITGVANARVIALHEARMDIRLPQPGRYHVSFRYTPYWRASSGCLTRAADGMLSLTVPSAGVVHLSFDLDAGPVLKTLIGEAPTVCSRSGARVPQHHTSSRSAATENGLHS